MSVVVVLPVKELDRAKARLGESGIGPRRGSRSRPGC